MAQAFCTTDTLIGNQYHRLKNNPNRRGRVPDAGCTACCVVLTEDHHVFANLGDSRALLCKHCRRLSFLLGFLSYIYTHTLALARARALSLSLSLFLSLSLSRALCPIYAYALTFVCVPLLWFLFFPRFVLRPPSSSGRSLCCFVMILQGSAGKVAFATTDHKPVDPVERDRIYEAGW